MKKTQGSTVDSPLPEWSAIIPVKSEAIPGEVENFGWEFPLPQTLEYSGETFFFQGKLAATGARFQENESFWLEFRLSCKGGAPCSRCLKETPLEIEETFRYFYTPSAVGESEVPGDDMTVSFDPGESLLDIGPQIWESFVFSLPEKVLCNEKCAGLCPECGMDLNEGSCSCLKESVDPRLQALKKAIQGDSPD